MSKPKKQPTQKFNNQKTIIIALATLSLLASLSFANRNDVQRIADAIYWAEGGSNAKKPYGILSVPCSGERNCRKICINTIKNNLRKYKTGSAKKNSGFIEFLASSYAPIGAENDPNNLNSNWVKNVKYFIENPKPVERKIK